MCRFSHLFFLPLRLKSEIFSDNEGHKQIKWRDKSLGRKGYEERSKLRVGEGETDTSDIRLDREPQS